MSTPPITALLCERCGRDGNANAVANAEEYAKQASTPKQAAERFRGYIRRHPYLQRCGKCSTVYCTREGCTCRC